MVGRLRRFLPHLGLGALTLVLLASFWMDADNAGQGGAIDLRNRITGVRLLEGGVDPYHYKWHNGDPDVYCDVYNNPNLPVSKTTVTPALLLLHAPYAAVPYRLGQFLWLATQWGLLAGTGALWWCACPKAWQRWLIVAFIVGFTYTGAWRLHAERGQSYVMLAFVFSAWLAVTPDRKWGDRFAAGFLAGLLVALRPPFVLLGLFLGLHRRGQLLGAVVGVAVGVIVPTLVHPAIWPEYFTAARQNASLYLGGDQTRPGQQHYPSVIENTPTDLIAHFEPISFADFSIHAILRDLGLGPFPGWPFEIGVVIAFAGWLWLTRVRPGENLLPGLAAWFFVIDLCLPVYRQSYNDVLALAVFGSALSVATRFPWALGFGLIALVAGWFVAWATPEERWQINLPALGFTLMALALLFFIDNRFALRKVDAAC
jgi:hypothetical protein